MIILYMIGNGFDIHIGLVYLAITYLGSVHCFCGLQILILNGSGLQIQTNGTARTSAGSGYGDMPGYLTAIGSMLSHMVITSWSIYLAPK